MRDELVGEGETGKEAAFLEPKDSTESAREEDAFDSSKHDEAFSKGSSFHVGPVAHPINLTLDAGKVVNCIKKLILFSLVLHNGSEEIGVSFSMDGFDVRLNDKRTV